MGRPGAVRDATPRRVASDMTRYYAHSKEGLPETHWEPLEDHLRLVAEGQGRFPGAACFAAAFASADWGRLLGWWHDLGKYSAEFQAYLLRENGYESHLETRPGKVDHSTAGAQHAARRFAGPIGRILAYCIAGHHGGLLDNQPAYGGASLANRIKEPIATVAADALFPREDLRC